MMANIEVELPKVNSKVFYLKLSAATCLKTERRLVNVEVSRKFKGAVALRLVVTGGKAQSEDYGFGRDFTGSGTWVNDGYERNYVRLDFGENELSKTINLQLEDNLVVEPDKILRFYLLDENGKTYGEPKSLTIVDDRLAAGTFVDVSNPPGGLSAMVGGSDETAKFNAIVDYIKANNNGKGVIYFPEGNWYLDRVNTGPHITIIGKGLDQSILKTAPRPIISSNISVSNSTKARVTCNNHGLATGNRCFFTNTNWGSAIESYAYYVVKVDDNRFDLIRWISGWNYYGSVSPRGAKWRVRELIRGTTTTVKATYDSAGSTQYMPIAVNDYVYFSGLPAPWDVLNGNHYKVLSLGSNTFTIDFNSAGLASDGAWDNTNYWCGATLDTSGLSSWSAGELRQQLDDRRTFVLSATSNQTYTPSAFKNLTLDNNRYYLGPYHRVEIEHCTPLIIYGTASYRAHTRIENCRFSDAAGDGIYKGTYSTIKGYKLYFVGNKRGSVTFGPTNSLNHEVELIDLQATGDILHRNAINQEYVTTGSVVLKNYSNDYGSIIASSDATAAPGCTQTIEDFSCKDLMVSGYGNFLIRNGSVYCRDTRSYIYSSYNVVSLTNISFTIGKGLSASDGYFFLGNPQPGTINFTNCSFVLDSANPPDNNRYGVYSSNTFTAANSPTVTFTGCSFGAGLAYGLYIARGGKFIFNNCTYGSGYLVRIYGASTCQLEITLRGNQATAGNSFYCYIHVPYGSESITINHPLDDGQYTTVLTYPASQYVVSNDTNFGQAGLVFTGGRYILGTGTPSGGVNGMPGDVYEDTQTGQKWTVTDKTNAGWTRPDLTIKTTTWTAM